MNGFYAGYFAGTAGNGIGMFILNDGVLTGADALGALFDGSYVIQVDGQLLGKVTVTIPPNVALVQGVVVGSNGMKYDVDVSTKVDQIEKTFLRLETPVGPVNVALKKIRGL
ncbi:hypothetical protein [Methyloraptor flagellatus]|uniref:Uncharacterized protein n=1 Tax=Methyloraptor flagellatus TaxID=3162530 RepID=A0AAU7XGB4_9HYPH